MVHSITQKIVGRMASVLFVVIGATVAANAFLPTSERTSRPVQILLGATAVVLGVCAWFVPWERWPAGRTRLVIPAVLVVLSASGTFGSYTPYTYDSAFIVLFAWIGIAQPRGVALRMLPVATAAFLLPLVVHDPSMLALSSTIETMFLCGLVGEALSWMSGRLRQAESIDSSRLWEMQSLLRAGEMMARQTQAGLAAELVANLAVQLLRSEGAVVLLLEDGDTLAGGGSFHWPTPPEDGLRIELDEIPELRRVLLENETVSLPIDRLEHQLRVPEDSHSVLAVPLRATSGAQGLLLAGLAARAGAVDTFTDHVARTFGTQAGLTLERLHATEALVDETLRDELTGLGNRRLAKRALARLDPTDAVVMLDLDRFKELNDSRGHGAGDLVLCDLATLLRSALRENDVAVRMGGDEFLLVLRGAGSAAIPTMERLSHQWRTESGVTFSAGVAMYRPGETAEQALGRADQALYRSKRGGRDRISRAERETDPVPA
jgi:diguanylate cyclase (GGDEF)-like protein